MRAKVWIRRLASLLLAVLAALLCACTGACTGGGKPTPTEEPKVTEAPEVEYTMTHMIRYWPEDADYDTCDYACVTQIPQFSRSYTSGYAMNKAVDKYVEGLEARIENRYMPAAVAQPPSTEVACAVEFTGGITNVIFTEKHAYEAQPYYETYVLMLDENGEEVNLCDVFMNYHADRLIAERIADSIKGDARFREADADAILNMIDVTHGARVQNGGCTVYVHEGLLADYDMGEISFDLTFDDVHPDFVGESKAMTLEEYRGIVGLLHYVSDAAVVRGEDITDGTLSRFEASSFMGELAQTLDILPKAGRVDVPEERFLELYRACFMAEFPGVDTDGHDIKLEDGCYRVFAKGKDYVYNVDMLSAERNGDELDISGDLIFGKFGYASTAFVCHVSVKLVKNAESPFGFALREYVMSA